MIGVYHPRGKKESTRVITVCHQETRRTDQGQALCQWQATTSLDSSPTVSTESVLLTAIIDAEEGRDVMTSDVPNAFVQTEHPLRDEDGARTILRIRRLLVDILCELD